MRDDLIVQLDALCEKLGGIRTSSSSWVDQFLQKNPHAKHAKHILCSYNSFVLQWLEWWSYYFLEQLCPLAHASQPEVILHAMRTELLSFLTLRHQTLPVGICDLTASPKMPANAACLSAIKVILRGNESACQLLMPWVTRVIGVHPDHAENIKEETENEHGDFLPTHFVSYGDHALVDVVSQLHYTHHDTTQDFATRFFQNKGLQKRIVEAVGAPAENYLKALAYDYRQKTQNTACFSFHVYALATALHNSSVDMSGTEAHADPTQCWAHIANFYTLWNALPDTQRNAIGALTLPASGYRMLQAYLLQIFFWGGVPLSPADAAQAAAQSAYMLNCSKILSSILFSFESTYHEPWRDLIVTHTAALLPSISTDFNQLALALEKGLTEPARIYACTDAFGRAICANNATKYTDFMAAVKTLPAASAVDHYFPGALILQYLAQESGDQYVAWEGLSSLHKNVFNAPPSIMLLFFQLRNNQHPTTARRLISAYADIIDDFFYTNAWRLFFYRLAKQCERCSVIPTTVYRHFINILIQHAPANINSVATLITCLTAFDTADQFQHVLRLLGPIRLKKIFSRQRTKRGALVDYHNSGPLTHFLQTNLQKTAICPTQFNWDAAAYAVIEAVLPLIISVHDITALFVPAQYLSFFCEDRADKAFVHDLYSLHKSTLTPFQKCCELMIMTNDFIRTGKGGPFLKAIVRKHATGFFASVAHTLSQHRTDAQSARWAAPRM